MYNHLLRMMMGQLKIKTQIAKGVRKTLQERSKNNCKGESFSGNVSLNQRLLKDASMKEDHLSTHKERNRSKRVNENFSPMR